MAEKMNEEYVSLRLLHREQNSRIFINSVRIDPHHEKNATAWRRVAGQMWPSDRIIWLTYWHADAHYFANARKFYEGLPVPLEHIWVLGNTSAEADAAAEAGFRSAWINHNCWLDENLIAPVPVEKVFRAVLTAQPVAHKRIHLAAQVEDLAFIPSAPFHVSAPVDIKLAQSARIFTDLPSHEVPRVISQSRVGLCLSALEGACYASSEYLMCGLPVVSTASAGGRDVFYNSYNSLIADPDEASITDAVEALIRRECDPIRIRRDHLAQNKTFRERFIYDVLGAILNEIGSRASAADIFESGFLHKMVEFIPESKAVGLLTSQEDA